MNHQPLLSIWAWALLAWVAQACALEEFDRAADLEHYRALAFPLVDTRYQIQDFISDFETGGYVEVAPDGLISVVYTGKLLTINVDELYARAATALVSSVSGDTLLLPLQINAGDSIANLQLENGQLDYELNVEPGKELAYTFTLANVRRNGQALSQTITLPAAQNTGSVKGSIDLSQSQLTQPDGTPNAGGQLMLVFEDDPELNQAKIQAFKGALKELTIQFVEGYVGVLDLGEYRDTLAIDLFRSFVSGKIEVESPKIYIRLKNEAGLPTKLSIVSFTGENNQGEKTPANGENHF